jgi:hypothetical protein
MLVANDLRLTHLALEARLFQIGHVDELPAAVRYGGIIPLAGHSHVLCVAGRCAARAAGGPSYWRRRRPLAFDFFLPGALRFPLLASRLSPLAFGDAGFGGSGSSR